jgi:uncharacterized alpha-E superfamily protein
MERALSNALILDVNYQLLLEQPHGWGLRWEPLIEISGEEERFRSLYPEANSESVFEFMAFRADNPSSIIQCVEKARENARTIRERISREMWEDINGLYHQLKQFEVEQERHIGPHRFCSTVKIGRHRFHGTADATLLHDVGWHFLKAGGWIESAEITARIVDVQYHLVDVPLFTGSSNMYHQWMAILRSCGAYEAYRRQYQSQVEPELVAEMLVLNPLHPHSIRFAMVELQACLRSISGAIPGTYANEAERLTGKVLEGLRYDTIEDVFAQGLHDYLQEIQRMCRVIGDQIARSYFYYAVSA